MTTQCAAVIADIDRIGLDGLRDAARGTAYVESIDVQTEQTLVRLAYPFGRHVEVRVPAEVEGGPSIPVQRPLAVQVRAGAALQCSVLDSADTGPTRIPISLQQALTLANTGVHTTFMAD